VSASASRSPKPPRRRPTTATRRGAIHVRRIRTFARRALWALPVWSALLVWGTLTHQPDPQTDFAAFAAYVTTREFLASHLVASILGAAIGSVGVVALLLYLQATPAAGWAAGGMVATIMGNTLTTAIFGVAAFVQPALGIWYLTGQPGALELYNAIYAAPLFGMALAGLLLFIVGAACVGRALVLSRRYPAWLGWAYALAATVFVLSNFLLPTAQTPAALILLGVTVIIARRAAL
jgi:hypothetical protein